MTGAGGGPLNALIGILGGLGAGYGVAVQDSHPCCLVRVRVHHARANDLGFTEPLTVVSLTSPEVTDETANFLSVGVQLLPVLWLVLGVETTWLRSQLRQTEQNFQRAAAQQILGFSFLVGAVAECLALFVLHQAGPAAEGLRGLEGLDTGLWLTLLAIVAKGLLFAALVYSVLASAWAMYRVVTAKSEVPPSSTM